MKIFEMKFIYKYKRNPHKFTPFVVKWQNVCHSCSQSFSHTDSKQMQIFGGISKKGKYKFNPKNTVVFLIDKQILYF